MMEPIFPIFLRMVRSIPLQSRNPAATAMAEAGIPVFRFSRNEWKKDWPTRYRLSPQAIPYPQYWMPLLIVPAAAALLSSLFLERIFKKNPRPADYKSAALPTELHQRIHNHSEISSLETESYFSISIEVC